MIGKNTQKSDKSRVESFATKRPLSIAPPDCYFFGTDVFHFLLPNFDINAYHSAAFFQSSLNINR